MSDAGWALTNFYHTVVNCRDLDESVAFYRLLGFEVLNDRRNVKWPAFVAGLFGLTRASGRGVLMVLPADPTGPMIDLLEWIEPKADFPDPAKVRETVPRILAFRTRNVHQAYTELSAQGVRFAQAVHAPVHERVVAERGLDVGNLAKGGLQMESGDQADHGDDQGGQPAHRRTRQEEGADGETLYVHICAFARDLAHPNVAGGQSIQFVSYADKV